MNRFDGIKKAECIAVENLHTVKNRKSDADGSYIKGLFVRICVAIAVIIMVFTVNIFAPDSEILSGVKEAVCRDYEESITEVFSELFK